MFTGLVECLGRIEQTRRGGLGPPPHDRLAGPSGWRAPGARRERGGQRLLPDGDLRPTANDSRSRRDPRRWPARTSA